MKKSRKKIRPIALSFVFLIGAIWFIVLHHIPITMDILSLKFIHPFSTSFMRFKSAAYPLQRQKYKWVSYSKISDFLKDAVVIAEDDRFFKHSGLDWKAIHSAAERNWKKKRLYYGGSTITQQLAKNLYLYPIKDPLRKIREAGIAILLDFYLPKKRILEIYLNTVEWGPNVYGAEAAAKYYFKGSAKNLNAPQSAFLASILPNPVKNGKRGYRLTNHGQSILRRIQ